MTNRWGKSKNTDRFYFLRFQNHYRWWLQPWNFFQAMLAPRKKSYDKLRQHAEKQRHHLSTKVHTVKGMVFPVVMYRCHSWTIKKAEHWRIDDFELWCQRRLLRNCWTARRSNQSILKDNSVQFSRSVVSDSLWPHEPQHTRTPCPSTTPKVYPNPCPLSWWCHPTISSSVISFSSCPQSFPASGSFPMSWLFISSDQLLELQLQHQSLQWIFRVDYL